MSAAERPMSDPDGFTDLGHGVRVFTLIADGEPSGLVLNHPHRDNGQRCSARVGWGKHGPHTLVSLDPLHVEASVLCQWCGLHGFIRDGKWVPA